MPKNKEWTFTELDDGVLALDGTPLRIYYNSADAHGAPAELWHDSSHLSTWAKLNVAQDMAKKKANEWLVRERARKRREGA